jgi:hypothetical protein
MLTFPITELDVQALIDSQLGWEEEKQVLQELAHNSELNSYYKDMLKQKKLLVEWWHLNAEEGEGALTDFLFPLHHKCS